jgi:hypothetical protein
MVGFGEADFKKAVGIQFGNFFFLPYKQSPGNPQELYKLPM